MTTWNSALYLKFESERTRAAGDLLARVPPVEAKFVCDLGCGPGNSTELLAKAFPEAKLMGLDHSEDMISVARRRVPTAEFVHQDIESWRPTEQIDVIFANAALHFLPDHEALMKRLVSHLRPGGCLAVQMPNNMQEASHAAMRMLAADGPWARRLVPIAKGRPMIGPPDEYYELLAPLCRELDIWQTNYLHSLNGPDDVVSWFEGSELNPFLEPLSPEERADFLSRYRAELAADYPRQANGKVLFRYPRLFFVLQK